MANIIKLKRTQTLGKRLLASTLGAGELFLNYHRDEPGLYFKDNDSTPKLRKVGAAHVGANPPNNNPVGGAEQSVAIGELWYVTDPGNPNHENLLIWTGSEWKAVISSISQI